MDILNKICVLGDGHCFYTRSAAASSVYVYAAVLAYTVSVSISRSRLGEHGHATHLLPVKRMKWFPTFLACSYLARMTWLVLSNVHAFEWVITTTPNYTYEHTIISVPYLPTSIDMYVLAVTSFGKLATLLYFSAFTLLLRFWEDVLHLALRAEKPLARIATNQSVIAEYTRASTQALPTRKLFLVANVWIYLVEFVLLCLKILFPHADSRIFLVDYAIWSLFFFLLAVMLARCAYKLRRVLLKIEFSPLAASIAWRITWLGFISSVVFFCRGLLMLVSTPVIEVFDPHRTNPWLFYTVWEIVPGFLVVFMMTVKKRRTPERPTGNGDIEEGTPLIVEQGFRYSDETMSPFAGHELRI